MWNGEKRKGKDVKKRDKGGKKEGKTGGERRRSRKMAKGRKVLVEIGQDWQMGCKSGKCRFHTEKDCKLSSDCEREQQLAKKHE